MSRATREQTKTRQSGLVQLRKLVPVASAVVSGLKLEGLLRLLEREGWKKIDRWVLTVTSSFQGQAGPRAAVWGVFKAGFCRRGAAA